MIAAFYSSIYIYIYIYTERERESNVTLGYAGFNRRSLAMVFTE